MLIDGKKKHVRRATYFAECLGVYDFSLEIVVDKEGSECRRFEDGSFQIALQRNLDDFWMTKHLAHEMVHLRQFKHGELRQNGTHTYWKGERVFDPEYMSDEYFLAPWEMEARALEDWLAHKWGLKENELH